MARTLCLHHFHHLHLVFRRVLLMGEAYRIGSVDPDRSIEKRQFAGVFVFVVGLDEFRNVPVLPHVLVSSSCLLINLAQFFFSQPSRYQRLHPSPHRHRPNVPSRAWRLLRRPSRPIPHQEISRAHHFSLRHVWLHVCQSFHGDSACESSVLGEHVCGDAVGHVWTRFEF